jgi:N-acetylglucosamine-6-phosphate deacetylase
MPLVISCHSIVTPDEVIEPCTVVVDEDGRIAAVGGTAAIPHGAELFDLTGGTLVPGFIDIHVHGGGGFSLATRDRAELESYARWVVSHGVTGFLATIVAGGIHHGLDYVRTAAEATGPVEGGANLLGVNLEGPFVSEERRGALPRTWLRGYEPALLDLFIDTAEGQLRLITIAPEVDTNEKMISRAAARGIRVAIGHSNAPGDTARIAFNYGASHVTHLFNAMGTFHHRDPGILGAAYDRTDVTVEVIADGVHVDPTTVAMTVHLLGPERIALVSDAVPPAGSNRMTFRLGDKEARRVNDRILLDDGTIAGGNETMDHVVRNIVGWKAADLPDAVRMASTTPARILGLDDSKGRIAPGYDADLVALDPNLQVVATWVQGRLVYRRDL